MPEIAGLPFWELHLNETGKILKHVGAIPHAITDVYVAVHAWQNEYSDAGDLYHRFFTSLAEALVENDGAAAGHPVGLVGVFWPSVLQPQDEPERESTATANFAHTEDTAAGGTAAIEYVALTARAAVIGEHGLGPFLSGLENVARAHLIGHSFGARMVASALRTCAPKVATVSLLQGLLPADSYNSAVSEARQQTGNRVLLLPGELTDGNVATELLKSAGLAR